MTEREKFEQAIVAQESLRATLGDAAVDAMIAALKKRLESLEPQPLVEQQRKYVTVSELKLKMKRLKIETGNMNEREQLTHHVSRMQNLVSSFL